MAQLGLALEKLNKMDSLDAADPRVAVATIVNTALYSSYSHLISHGLPSQLNHALNVLKSVILEKQDCPILAVNLRVNYEFTFSNLSLISLADASFMACAKRICPGPVTKMLILSFASAIHENVSGVVLASSLVQNIPWSVNVPLSYLANVFQTFSGLIKASESKLARVLYMCVSVVLFTLDQRNYTEELPFDAARAKLTSNAHISKATPIIRESIRSLLWSLSCIYAYYLLQHTRGQADPVRAQELLVSVYEDFGDLLSGVLSPLEWRAPEHTVPVHFSFLSESEAMRITNDVLIQRAFVMRTIDDEEEQILSEIDAWQRTEEAAHAEEAFFQDKPLVIADTGQRIRRHGSHSSAAHEMKVPLFPLKKFQEAKDSDETYTSDSYSFGVTFSDVDIIQRHMGPDFCIPLRVTFYGMLAVLVDDSVETVRRMAIYVCNTIMGTIIRRFNSIDDILQLDGSLLSPSTLDSPHVIAKYCKVITLAPYHILREILYINQALLADSAIAVKYLMGAMRFMLVDLKPCDFLADLSSNIRANASLDSHHLTKRSMTFLFLDSIFYKLMLQIVHMSDLTSDIIDTLFLGYFPRLSVFSTPGSYDCLGKIRFYQNRLRDKKPVPEIGELIQEDISKGIDGIYHLLQIFNMFYTDLRAVPLPPELLKHLREACYLGAFICGSRPFLCELCCSPLLMGSNQALSNAFCLDVFDVKTVQLKLRETLHDSVMDRLGKGEFCNEIRVAFLWGFLLALRYAPPSIQFVCDHPCSPSAESLRSFTQ